MSVTLAVEVASSREDAWIETGIGSVTFESCASRPPARTRGLKQIECLKGNKMVVASSREDAWIET